MNLMDEKVKKKGSEIDGSNLGISFELEPNKGQKKKHKERKKKHGTDEILNSTEALEENCTGEAAERQACSVEGNITFTRNREEENHINKRKKKKGRKDIEVINSNIADDKEMQLLDDNQQSKMKKRKNCDDSLAGMREMGASKPSKKGKMIGGNEFKNNEDGLPLDRISTGDANAHRSKLGDANECCIVTEVDDRGKKMRVKKKTKASTGESPNPSSSGTSKLKQVTFSDRVEVCCDGLVRGKRFTSEEDEKIKEAVFSYIESRDLGDEGLDMVLHCKSHAEVRDCWKEIGAALPQRPNHSVYYRAHILFERGEKRKWTLEELEFIRKVQEQHGSDWKSIAEVLGKNRFHVKDAWRRIKLTNKNKGRWSQEEYQNLFDLVNLDLRARALEAYKKSQHGMLRDNIKWEAIGDKLATRSSAHCCKKWYEQLTSPMVAHGIWSDTDDYRLVNALFTLDACCMEEVDWGNLIVHRSGDVCRKRWNQMVQYIGQHGRKSFVEEVEILAKRFCPDLLEAREAFDRKPVCC